MPKYNYLNVDQVISIHDELINKFGGLHGISDKSKLESAVMRPQIGYYKDIIEEAAALMESLLVNHAFCDGNKRTAFFATDTFFRGNKYYIYIQDYSEAENFMVKILEPDLAKERFNLLYKWLNSNITKL